MLPTMLDHVIRTHYPDVWAAFEGVADPKAQQQQRYLEFFREVGLCAFKTVFKDLRLCVDYAATGQFQPACMLFVSYCGLICLMRR